MLDRRVEARDEPTDTREGKVVPDPKRPVARAQRAWSLIRGAPALLLLGLVLLCVANAVWIARNSVYIQDEVGSHLDGAADFRNRAWGIVAAERNPLHVANDLLCLMNSRSGGSLGWPRATYAVSALVSVVCPDAERWPFYSNFVFFLISVLGLLALMQQLLPHSRRQALEAAMIAALLWSLLPGTYGPLRLYGLDFPLACCMAPGLALAIATRGFSERGMSLCFGVFVAFGVSVKGQYLAYIAPAIVLCAAYAVRDVKHGVGASVRRRLLHLALAAIPPVLAIALWLHGSIIEVARLFYIMILPTAVDPALDTIRAPPKPFETFSLPWLTYWGRASVANLGVMGTLALAFSPALLARAKGRTVLHRDAWILIGSTLGMVVLWTIIPARDMRFVFPFLPAYAAIAALALMTLASPGRYVLVGALIALGLTLGVRLSVNPTHQAIATERIHRILGWDAGHIVARPAEADRLPGLADAIDRQLEAIRPGAPGRVALASVPYADGRSLFDHYNEHVRIESYRVKCRRRCVAWRENAFLHPRTYQRLGSSDTLDPRYIPPTYFDHEALDLDLLVVCHFPTEYDFVDPPYPSWAFSGFMPDLFAARTLDEIRDRLPPGFRLVHQMRFDSPGLPQTDIYFFENPHTEEAEPNRGAER